jgi:ketosteroid isomerase-like protein
MKRIFWCALVCGFVILLRSGTLSAESLLPTADQRTTGGPTTSPADQADHDALRALVPMYEDAANNGKLEALKPYLDPEFSGVMVTGEEVTNFASMEEYWARMQTLLGEGGTYHVKVNVAERAILSGDLAVARGTTEDVVKAKGSEYRFEGRWTAVCRKRGGQWKMLRIQASMDPVTNPFVMAAVRAASMTAGAIAGIAGLIVGGVLSAILIRRRKA